MDSVAINSEVSTYVKLQRDNGALNPTVFNQLKNSASGYTTVSTVSLTCDVVHYKEYVLAGGETIAVNLASGLENPVDLDTVGDLARCTQFECMFTPNEDGSTNSESIRFGNCSVTPAQLFFGSVSQTLTLPNRTSDGSFLWRSDRGVPRGGTLLLIENLDPTNDATFTLLLVGRSA